MGLRGIIALPLILGLSTIDLPAPPDKGSPRHTPIVRVVQKTEHAVVALFSQKGNVLNMGSGSLIHKDGYVLTNDHVIGGNAGVILFKDQDPINYSIVGRMPEKDLCLLRAKPRKAVKPLRLGRSNDLVTGEPILCAGNPGGRGIVYSSGIISSPNFMLTAPNALVVHYLRHDVRDRFIQFDAASNQGNSGGALINALGEQIGVVSNKSPGEENINFAIPIDRVRQNLVELFSPEIRKGFETGITIDPLSKKVKVAELSEEGPAAKAGLKTGDMILAINGKSLQGPVDWMAALLEREVGDELKFTLGNGKQKRETKLKLTPYKEPEAVELKNPKAGLRFKVCFGSFVKAPDMAEQKVVKEGIARALDIVGMANPKTDDYAISLEGFLKIPGDGTYRLILNSDDGGLLRIGDELVIDNDGLHPAQDVGRLFR
ncbi:MAG: trypsin-like peptidase domain-containing protein, partial [Opitutales bacterium]